MSANNTFVNPYTFIGLEKKVNRSAGSAGNAGENKFTGMLHCTLETLSPLFIPNTTNEHMFPHKDSDIARHHTNASKTDPKSFEFYGYENLEKDENKNGAPFCPIIPGSSIRGMIRSAYEAVTNSCLSTTDPKTPLHKRTNTPYTNYGIVKDGKLYAAHKALIVPTTDNGRCIEGFSFADKNPSVNGTRLLNGKPTKAIAKIKRSSISPWQEIYVTLSAENDTYVTSDKTTKEGKIIKGHPTGHRKVVNYSINSAEKNSHEYTGYYIMSEPFGTGYNKHFDAVIYGDSNRKPIRVLQKDEIDELEKAKTLVKLYQNKKDNVYQGFAETNPMPVYYEIVGEGDDSFVYLSPACISKEVFTRTVHGILEQQGEFNPCVSVENLCTACSLFGMVGKNDALASRVSFRDAAPPTKGTPDKWDKWYDDLFTMAILGTPQISAVEFYMEDPGAQYSTYNYDYAVINKHKKPLKDNQVKLRGRKFYWHSKKPLPADIKNDNPKQLWTVRPVSKNKKFTFEVAFDSLTLEELSSLYWVLTIGNNAAHAHKLGHGKPIGFGSVQITIDDEKSKVFVLNNNLSICQNPLPKLAPFTPESEDAFLRITQIQNGFNNVQYPQGQVNGKQTVYNWFVLNREMPPAKPNSPALKNVLPDVLDEQELPYYSKQGKQGKHDYEPKNTPSNRMAPNPKEEEKPIVQDNPFTRAFNKR